MNPSNRELFAHLAAALGLYRQELRRNGMHLSAEMEWILVFLGDCAGMRQDATNLALAGQTADCGHMDRHLMLTKREAAASLRISVRSLERILARPDSGLSAVQVEGGVRIRRADLDAYVAGLTGGSFRDQIEEKAG